MSATAAAAAEDREALLEAGSGSDDSHADGDGGSDGGGDGSATQLPPTNAANGHAAVVVGPSALYSSSASCRPSTRRCVERCVERQPLPVCGALASVGGVLFGYDMGIVGSALLLLRDEFGLGLGERELVVSVTLVGAVVGSLVGGALCDHPLVGRRRTIMFAASLFALSALVLMCAQGVRALIVGRFLVGCSIAVSGIADVLYLTELAPRSLRGRLVSLNEVAIVVGILLSYLAGYFLIDVRAGWRWMFGLSLLPAAVQGTLMMWLPNSPRWLAATGRPAEARRVLILLRGSSSSESSSESESPESSESVLECESESKVGVADGVSVEAAVDAELQEMADAVRAERDAVVRAVGGAGAGAVAKADPCFLCAPRQWWALTRATALTHRRALFIGCGLVTLQAFTGQPNVLIYMPTLLEGDGGLGFESHHASTLATVGVGFAKLLFTLVSLWLLDRGGSCGGRRRLLLVGVTMMCVAMLSLAVVVFRGHSGGDLARLRPFVLVLLFAYVGGFALGFGPCTWLLMSEIFSAPVRGRLVGWCQVLGWSANLLLSATFLHFLEAYGSGGTFLVYGIIGVFAIAFVAGWVPETRGRTLEAIEHSLNSTAGSTR